MKPTHIGFADESRYTSGQYRALAVVSLAFHDLGGFDAELRALLDDSGVRELSWRNVTSARDRYAALKVLAWTVREASARRLRADVLTWDTQDVRHTVKGRDDIANLHRMYHHLLNDVLAKRWPDEATWIVRPDENTAMTWNRMAEFLRLKEPRLEQGRPGLWKLGKRRFYLLALQPARSHEHPLVQVADLLAGLGSYSRLRYEGYAEWLHEQRQQMSLWDASVSKGWSGSEHERFQVMNAFNDLCKAGKFRVSLDTQRGFRTMHTGSPLNFWWYEPQHDLDRAPSRLSD